MKIDVKKNGETILHREDAKSITDNGGVEIKNRNDLCKRL